VKIRRCGQWAGFFSLAHVGVAGVADAAIAGVEGIVGKFRHAGDFGPKTVRLLLEESELIVRPQECRWFEQVQFPEIAVKLRSFWGA
jgi:hypothetical protein